MQAICARAGCEAAGLRSTRLVSVRHCGHAFDLRSRVGLRGRVGALPRVQGGSVRCAGEMRKSRL